MALTDLITQAYGGIGRSGFGTETNQIDQQGFNYWRDELESGRIAPENFQNVFNTAVQNYVSTAAPDDPYVAQIKALNQVSSASPPTQQTTYTQPENNFALSNVMASDSTAHSESNAPATVVPLSSTLATEADRVNEYNRLRNAGYSDAQIRTAANEIYGTQKDEDWSYLQSKASGVPLSTTIATEADAISEYNRLIDAGYSDAQIRNAASNVYGEQNDKNWSYLNQVSSFDKIIQDAYADIGRAGFGEETSQIDRAGYNYWMDELKNERITPEQFGTIFNNAVDKFIQENPENLFSKQAVLVREIPGQFTNESGETDFATLNKGFEWAQENEIDDKRLKNILGEEQYNEYVDKYGKGILETLRPALEDDKISPQEALDIVTSVKSLGLDASEIAKYTGLDQRVPDAFFNTYDRVVSGIVGNALDPESTQTEQQKVGGILALQTQYGLTDKDIADYSNGKVTEDDVKNYLGGVKTFQSDFQALISKPDVTAKEISDFIDNSRKSRAVTALYGDSINTFDQKLDDLEGKWKSSGVDALQAETVYNQLKTITDAAKGANWAGSWKGGGDGAALEATKLLVSRGVDNLSDLKVETNFEQTPTVEMYKGVPVYTSGGKRYIQTTGEFGPEYERVPDGAQTQLAAAYEDSSGEGDNYHTFTNYRPLTAQELETYDSKTGKFALESGTKLIDGSSGKIIAKGTGNNFILDSYDTGNFFKGKSKKLGIQMTDSGIPVPYQIEKKEGFVYSPALPLFASLLVPGLAGAVSGVLPGSAVAASGAAAAVPATALNTALSQAITGGLVGGGVAALRDGDILKGVVGGAANPLLSYGIGQLVPTNLIPGGMDTTLGRTLTNTGANVARAAFSGGDLGRAALTGITSGALDYALKPAFDALNLSPTQVNLLTGIVMPAALTGNVNPISALSTLAGAAKSGANK